MEPSTSGASPYVSNPQRQLRPEEAALLDAILPKASSAEHLRADLKNSVVEQMKDGGMGSLRFIRSMPRRMERELVSASYLDEDGVLVKISIDIDEQGDLFELDVWKVNFSPLRHFPEPWQVTLA